MIFMKEKYVIGNVLGSVLHQVDKTGLLVRANIEDIYDPACKI